jgi:hypothetical protein
VEIPTEEEIEMSTAAHAGQRVEEAGEDVAGAHDETRWALLTTEFWAMLLLSAVILIAAAASDSLDDNRAWTLVTIIGAAYILSRGVAKSGTRHVPFLRRGRRI